MGWLIDTILPAAMGIYQQKQANKVVKKYNVPTAAEKQSAKLYAALADPNSPLLQQFTQQQRDLNLADFQTQIREMQLADRRAGQMGRSPTFFQPERADEVVNYLTTRGMAGLNANAQQQAIDRIRQAAGGVQTNQPYQADRLGISAQNALKNTAAIPQTLMDIFSPKQTPMYTAQDLFSKIGKPASYGPQQLINWNISR